MNDNSNHLILFILLLYITFLLSACGNKFEIPSDVNVNVANSTQTVNVVHTVGISLEMTQMFEATCVSKIDSQSPAPTEPVRSELIKLCVAETSQKFMESILAIINQGTLPQ